MSTSLTLANKKTVAEVRNYARTWEFEIENKQKNFENKGWIGLKWDSKQPCGRRSFPWMSFKTSNKQEVVGHMEKYRAFYEEIADLFAEQFNNCSDDFYDRVIDINEKLDTLIKEAEREKNDTTSSAVFNLLKEFLADKCNLDHKLKKVECVALNHKIVSAEESCKKAERLVEDLSARMATLLEENRASANNLNRQQADAERRYQDLQTESNERLRVLQEESNQRLERMQGRTDKRMEELQEENRRTLQLILQFMNMTMPASNN